MIMKMEYNISCTRTYKRVSLVCMYKNSHHIRTIQLFYLKLNLKQILLRKSWKTGFPIRGIHPLLCLWIEHIPTFLVKTSLNCTKLLENKMEGCISDFTCTAIPEFWSQNRPGDMAKFCWNLAAPKHIKE